jgi:hypothetical protein
MRGLKKPLDSRILPKEMSSEKESNSPSVSEKPRGKSNLGISLNFYFVTFREELIKRRRGQNN